MSAAVHADLSDSNLTLAHGSGRGLGMGLIVAGALCALATAGAAFSGAGGISLKQWLAAYHVGAMSVLAMCLGSLFFIMAFHLTNAGWASAIRRQFENVASFLPFAFLLVLPTLVIEVMTHGKLFLWLSHDMAGDPLLEHKKVFFYLNQPIGGLPVFFIIRAVLYVLIWTYLARRLCKLSRMQDASGDIALSAQARRTSAWGMLAFALSVAFASFDWLMSMDFKFFSTMWGVYYFSGAAFSAAGLVAIVLARLVGAGKLKGVVTSEHFHDLGKLMFSFTVFWAYIAFFQYFLIWYSNIPEETAFYVYRNNEPWKSMGVFLMLGHFVVPFLILLFRPVKKSPAALTVMGLWALIVQVVDLYWVVRPMVHATDDHAPSLTPTLWLDVLAIIGPLLVLAGYLFVRVSASCLVARRDPWMPEALAHRNYV